MTLTLAGNNTLTAGSKHAGLQAESGTTLTINGDGALTATGGNQGAGIGGGGLLSSSGNITINGGKVIPAVFLVLVFFLRFQPLH